MASSRRRTTRGIGGDLLWLPLVAAVRVFIIPYLEMHGPHLDYPLPVRSSSLSL